MMAAPHLWLQNFRGLTHPHLLLHHNAARLLISPPAQPLEDEILRPKRFSRLQIAQNDFVAGL